MRNVDEDQAEVVVVPVVAPLLEEEAVVMQTLHMQPVLTVLVDLISLQNNGKRSLRS